MTGSVKLTRMSRDAGSALYVAMVLTVVLFGLALTTFSVSSVDFNRAIRAIASDPTRNVNQLAMYLEGGIVPFNDNIATLQQKWEKVVLRSGEQKLELTCCAGRADRRRLVLASWWESSP